MVYNLHGMFPISLNLTLFTLPSCSQPDLPLQVSRTLQVCLRVFPLVLLPVWDVLPDLTGFFSPLRLCVSCQPFSESIQNSFPFPTPIHHSFMSFIAFISNLLVDSSPPAHLNVNSIAIGNLVLFFSWLHLAACGMLVP